MDDFVNMAGDSDTVHPDVHHRCNQKLAALQVLLDFSLTSHQLWQKSDLFYAAGRTAMQMTGAQACRIYFRQRADPNSERLGESIFYRLDQILDDSDSDGTEDQLPALPQGLIESLAIRHEITRQADNSHLLVPIHRDSKLMALLDLAHSERNHFDEIDIDLMMQLVRQLDVTLQNEYVITTRTAQIELSQYLSAELDLAVLLNKVASSAAKIANAQASSILLIQQQPSNVMRFAAVYGLSDQDQDVLRQLVVPLHGSMAGSVVLTGQPLLSNDVASDPRFYAGVSNTVEMKTRSLLAVPMVAQDKAIGALEVINQRYDDGFNPADVEILTLFASQAAIAIQNARLLAERQTSLTELTKLEKRKSQFIALVSHELRTPLNLISGYLSLLRLSLPRTVDADHEVMEFLQHVEQSTNSLIEMVNNITSLYNLETGRTQLLLEKHDVIPIVSDVVAEHKEWARTKGIELRCSYSDQAFYANCDHLEVNRILGNLLNNALKFTPEGGQITISVAQTPVQKKSGSAPAKPLSDIRISVADTGPGIDAEQLESIFERFSQLSSHMTRTQSGIGLGLPLARGLVEKHGGQLWAEVRPGEGALFHFTLPAVE